MTATSNFLTLSPRSAHIGALLNMVYTLAPKWHIRALLSSQSPSNKTINNVPQNGGDLKRIYDISSEFFRVFLAELQICLQGDLNMANFYTDIDEFCRICFKTPEDIYRLCAYQFETSTSPPPPPPLGIPRAFDCASCPGREEFERCIGRVGNLSLVLT